MPRFLLLHLACVATALTLSFLLGSQIVAAEASTDLVSAYYHIYWYQEKQKLDNDAGSEKYDAKNTMQLAQSVPSEITENLQFFGLNFDSLPGLLQRAVLWDRGYTYGDNGSLAEIYTRCDSSIFGATMNDLALEARQVKATGCDVRKCLVDDSAAISWSLSSDCGPDQIDDVVQCACTSVKTTAKAAPVWTTGPQFFNLSSYKIPEALVRRHIWSDNSAGRSAILYAIHTDSEFQDKPFGAYTCLPESSGSLTVPCIEYDASDDRWCRPKNSSLMTKWLKEYAHTLFERRFKSVTEELGSNSCNSDSNQIIQYDSENSATRDTNVTRLQNEVMPGGWHRTIPVLIVGFTALLVTGIAVFVYLRQRSEHRKLEMHNSAVSCSSSMNNSTKPPNELLVDRADVFGNPHSVHDFLEILSSSPNSWESSPVSLSLALTAESLASESPGGKLTDRTLINALINDPQLKHTKIPFDQLQFHHLIARGSICEVWLCVLHDRCVAVKRLPKEQGRCWSDIKAFVREIRLGAMLQHPSILSFVGISWGSLHSLCLVNEYLELGDLHEYLRQADPNRDQTESYEDFMCFSLTWKRDKMQILLDITRGLAYLHHHGIIHGDLKAKNVLLSATVDAKLAGFGTQTTFDGAESKTSQRRLGTLLWSAPEVFAGEVQSEKTDIFSLGVLIAELDTHRPPYSDAVTARGTVMPPLQVLQRVVSGHLKPSLLSTCPDEIVDLAGWCLHRDPKLRPSARDVVQAVRSIPGVSLDEFSL
ncbi:unnamed protein product [Phytophthora fragariaefolia]|uniref:Unnamed protein product n=1 Tax=Phytophthora fragariaefolia TaxID=1490495 RepID=A0A9W6XG61_9STRA|nr:unnamed protein product [Phytophthora fragariaefolia]